MIGISSRLFDLNGSFIFNLQDYDVGDDLDEGSRRVTRAKTLNGGVYINDNGYVAGDKTISILLLNPKKDLVNRLKALLQNHGEVTISMNDEVLLCVPESYLLSGGNFRIIFLAKELLS
ncbi:MAG: hypothetical protein KZQ83_14960 [gamma proteobacterium symbiont of Taylorina sp.]|nr:hypothetical protein [gamma proteobacterium symbiont of Taylorina sp.]